MDEQKLPTDQATALKEQRPLRQPLRDLETPPAVAAAVAATCRRLDLRTAQDIRRAEEELKLQYYYGGRDVACLDTPQGRLVLAVGNPLIEDLPQLLHGLPPSERRQVAILSPEPWEERILSAPSVSFDEV